MSYSVDDGVYVDGNGNSYSLTNSPAYEIAVSDFFIRSMEFKSASLASLMDLDFEMPASPRRLVEDRSI